MVLCVTTDSIEAGVSGQAKRCGGNRGDGSTHITAAPANYQAPKYTRWGVVIAQLEGSLQDVDDFCVIAAVGSRSTPGGAADCRGGFDDVLSLPRHHIRDASFFVWLPGSGRKRVNLTFQFGITKLGGAH